MSPPNLVTADTLFQDTRYPLAVRLQAIWYVTEGAVPWGCSAC